MGGHSKAHSVWVSGSVCVVSLGGTSGALTSDQAARLPSGEERWWDAGLFPLQLVGVLSPSC